MASLNSSLVLTLFTSLITLMLGVFIFLNGTRRLANITLALLSWAIAAWTFGQAMGDVFVAKEIVLFWTRFNVGAAVLIPVFYLHFILAFLKLEHKQKLILYLAYSMTFILEILIITPFFIADIAPIAGFKYYPQPGPVYAIFTWYLFGVFIYAFVQMIINLRQADGQDLQRLLYVFLASIIGFAGGATAFLPLYGINFPVLSNFSLPLYVAITFYAIYKHKLLDISFYVRRGLVYSLITLLFTGFYVVLIVLASRNFQAWMADNSFFVTIIIIFLMVLLFQPLRDWLQTFVDKAFFMGEYRYKKTIDDLSAENKVLFRKLMQSDKLAALGTMAAGMAHEIKNPLASIKGMTQVLPENLRDKDFINDYVEMVPRQLDRINRIVENLLKAGRRTKIKQQVTDLNQILDEALTLNANLAAKQGVTVRKELQSLPSFKADHDQLQQVFTNLILNAIEAMPSGGILTARTTKVASQAKVVITDTGHGIAADQLEKIFDPFYSLKDKGTGLGLFVAYRIIEEHGGKIEVESQIRKGLPAGRQGTTFVIWLPIKQSRSA